MFAFGTFKQHGIHCPCARFNSNAPPRSNMFCAARSAADKPSACEQVLHRATPLFLMLSGPWVPPDLNQEIL